MYVQLYEFHKREIPNDPEEKAKFMETLLKFNVSIKQYEEAFKMPNITK